MDTVIVVSEGTPACSVFGRSNEIKMITSVPHIEKNKWNLHTLLLNSALVDSQQAH